MNQEVENLRRNCLFCGSANPPYTCPRCQQPYCKLTCYRHVDHQFCTETFYKGWVKTSLSATSSSDETKDKMLEILRRLCCREEDSNDLDSDDEDDGGHGDSDRDLQDLNDRLRSQLEISSPDELWRNLNPSDKEAVKNILDNQEISLWKPWWDYKQAARKLVSETSEKQEEPSSPVPSIPDSIPRLQTLTSRIPSESIQFQVLNILAAYVFTARCFNGDHVEEAKDSVEVLFRGSAALRGNLHIGSATESVYQLRDCYQQDPSLDDRTLCLVFHDVCEILKGPNLDNNCHYVCVALSDIIEVMKKAKSEVHSESKKKLKLAIKRVEYLQSWNLDYGRQILKNHIPSLQVEIASLTENVNSLEKIKRNLLAQREQEDKIVVL